jgi:hypothetical protein
LFASPRSDARCDSNRRKIGGVSFDVTAVDADLYDAFAITPVLLRRRRAFAFAFDEQFDIHRAGRVASDAVFQRVVETRHAEVLDASRVGTVQKRTMRSRCRHSKVYAERRRHGFYRQGCGAFVNLDSERMKRGVVTADFADYADLNIEEVEPQMDTDRHG